MPLALAQLADDDPRIRRVVGACGCIISTTTVRYPAILRGEKVYLDCTACARAVRVTAYEMPETRYCSSPKCARPDAPLSRYNSDPDGRCNACELREREAWLEALRNPHGCARDAIRAALASNGRSTAVQLERVTGVPVAAIYKHLIDLVSAGQVERIKPRRQLALYELAVGELAVAA